MHGIALLDDIVQKVVEAGLREHLIAFAIIIVLSIILMLTAKPTDRERPFFTVSMVLIFLMMAVFISFVALILRF